MTGDRRDADVPPSDPVADAPLASVEEVIERHWGQRPRRVVRLSGGMNSTTWLVNLGGDKLIAKQVAIADLNEFAQGCSVAAMLDEAGFITGRPFPTSDGRLVVREHCLALLERVEGRELSGATTEEQVWMASTLAAIHSVGDSAAGPESTGFVADWLGPREPEDLVHPWLALLKQEVATRTLSAGVTWSLIHTDPSPEAFIRNDETDTVGLIDWTGAKRGPTLYDVASAVMYLGGPGRATEFLVAYQMAGPLSADEMRLLDDFRQLRWVVQAAYFAHRLATDDLTGIDDAVENRKGFDDARKALGDLGLRTG